MTIDLETVTLGLNAEGKVLVGEPTADGLKLKAGKFTDVTEQFLNVMITMLENQIVEIPLSEEDGITILCIKHKLTENPLEDVFKAIEKLDAAKQKRAVDIFSRISKRNKDGMEYKGILDSEGKVLQKRQGKEIHGGEEPTYQKGIEDRGPGFQPRRL